MYQQDPIPASEKTLMLYVAYLYCQHLTYSTVHVYLSAVRSLHIFHGYGNPLDNKLLLKQTVKAVHVIRGDCTQKLPITLEILQKMYPIVSTFHGAQVLWAAMTLAFFGCLRSAELTVQKHFDPLVHLCVSDVTIHNDANPPYVIVTIKCSKTDTFRKGLHVYLGCTEHIDCCAHCSLNVLVQGRSGNIPLFQFSNGKSLSKNVFVNNTKLALSMLGFDHTKYSGHSYRSGAATSAAIWQVYPTTRLKC